MTDQTMTPEQALEWLEGLRNTTGDQVCAEIEAGKAAEAAQAFRAALEAAREDAERMKRAIADLLLYFKSGNSIPVEKATIKAGSPEIVTLAAFLGESK